MDNAHILPSPVLSSPAGMATRQLVLISAACRHCGHPGEHVAQPGTGPHAAKLLCGHCGMFVRWVSKVLAPFVLEDEVAPW